MHGEKLNKYSEKAVLKTQHISTFQNLFAAEHTAAHMHT